MGGDWLAITSEALDELAGYLERHPDIWTAPFGDVVRYIQERKSLSIQITGKGPTSLELSLQWPMDKQIYDVPLTLKVQLPSVWNAVAATGDGKPLQARITSGTSDRPTALTSTTTILLDVPAQTKSVRLFNPAP